MVFNKQTVTVNKSNLIPVLKSFSKTEIKEFEKFLDSPFFGCRKFVLKSYKVLIKYYPDFRSDDIKKEKMFAIMYKDKKYNDALMRRIISDLIRFSEEYMSYVNFKSNKAFRSSCSLNELRNRKLDNLFRIRSESILKAIKGSEIVDPLLILESYFVNVEVSEYRSFVRDDKMHESLGQANEDFIVFFLRLIYSYLKHTITFSNEIKIRNEIVFAFLGNFNIDSFLNFLEKNQSKYNPYLKMIAYSYKIVADKEDPKSISKLTDLMNRNPVYFSKNELQNIYASMVTFYRYRNEKYENVYLNEELSVYNKILEDKLFMDDKNMLQLSFCRNYIRLCVLNQDTNRIKEFCEVHYSNLPDLYKKDLTDYCDSVYFFEKKLFDKSLSAASKVNIDKELFKRDMKILKIKNFYELGYSDSLYAEIDNLKHFLSDSETIISDYMMKSRNFLKYVSSVIRAKENNAGVDLFMIREELEKQNSINEKKWLLEKIDELTKK